MLKPLASVETTGHRNVLVFFTLFYRSTMCDAVLALVAMVVVHHMLVVSKSMPLM